MTNNLPSGCGAPKWVFEIMMEFCKTAYTEGFLNGVGFHTDEYTDKEIDDEWKGSVAYNSIKKEIERK